MDNFIAFKDIEKKKFSLEDEVMFVNTEDKMNDFINK